MELYKLGPMRPRNFWGKPKFKIWRKILRILVNNFGASGNNFTKLVHVVCRRTGMKFWVRSFWGPAPWKIFQRHLVAHLLLIVAGKKLKIDRYFMIHLWNQVPSPINLILLILLSPFLAVSFFTMSYFVIHYFLLFYSWLKFYLFYRRLLHTVFYHRLLFLACFSLILRRFRPRPVYEAGYPQVIAHVMYSRIVTYRKWLRRKLGSVGYFIGASCSLKRCAVVAAICSPQCINGGRCVSPNFCLCLPGTHGAACEKCRLSRHSSSTFRSQFKRF